MENTIKLITEQKKKELRNDVATELLHDIKVQEQKKKESMKTIKYYCNRFRYYHYYCAEKLNLMLTVICIWIIKILFFLRSHNY
ncbi:hypothetical protein PUN28_011539 [Cardiocondyla obscurior]|uniref:Uncharacterized protein n=1 Tax=Cardiocondyla obscurior TaxID=286306 RepID=A0AAW2FH45_9HYME